MPCIAVITARYDDKLSYEYKLDVSQRHSPGLRISERSGPFACETLMDAYSLSAAQAQQIANAWVVYANALRDHEAKRARERGEKLVEPTPEPALAGGGE